MHRILVGYDGSEPARHAVAQAAALASLTGATVTVLTAAVDRLVRADGVETLAADEALGERVAVEGAHLARQSGAARTETRTAVEAPAEALIAEAARGYDLIVVGHRSLNPLHELFAGSTAKQVVDRAPCSVLVTR